MKVVTLLTDLRNQVASEGVAEVQAYDAFACFCKDKTTAKASSILSSKDSIETYSADIAADTASVSTKESEVQKRKADEQVWTKTLAETVAECAKQAEIYNAQAADFLKAIASLSDAIQALENSKPVTLLQVRPKLEEAFALANAMDIMTETKRNEARSLLQAESGVDPTDPVYKFRSQGIIDLLSKLHSEFLQKKSELDTEYGKTEATCNSTIKSLGDQLGENAGSITRLRGEVFNLKIDIGDARANLLTEQASLQDDQLYLKDLTVLCETRAKDHDQRYAMRADELRNIDAALAILNNVVSGKDVAVNKRALLVEGSASINAHTTAGVAAAGRVAIVSPHFGSFSFVQLQKASSGGKAFLRGARVFRANRNDEAVAFLRSEGERLHSSVLGSTASHVAMEPFTEVKVLIQKLIERLLAESTAEATKKGFCDTEVGKANQDRDNRHSEASQLDLEIQGLQLKQEELLTEMGMLQGALATLWSELISATETRGNESQVNAANVQTATEGLAAVKEALAILKAFYKQAAKATVLVQAKASPVDEDVPTLGFAGAYQGKQENSQGVIGLLEVIVSDFDRTIRTTTAAEKQAQANFVEFDRASRADISAKDEKLAIDQEDLEKTRNIIAQKMNDLRAAQSRLDDALRVLRDLAPMCIDTGMLYADRVTQRQAEIDALKRALDILTPPAV